MILQAAGFRFSLAIFPFLRQHQDAGWSRHRPLTRQHAYTRRYPPRLVNIHLHRWMVNKTQQNLPKWSLYSDCTPPIWKKEHATKNKWYTLENLQITHLERKMIFQTSMIMVHVNLPGCNFQLPSPFSNTAGLHFQLEKNPDHLWVLPARMQGYPKNSSWFNLKHMGLSWDRT